MITKCTFKEIGIDEYFKIGSSEFLKCKYIVGYGNAINSRTQLNCTIKDNFVVTRIYKKLH